jgi:hypothetical protein
MHRCPVCGNEAQFIVTETVRQRSLIESGGPFEYNYLQLVESLTVEEWEQMECVPCGAILSEEECLLTFTFQHPEETPHAPDVTPQPGPLAQP